MFPIKLFRFFTIIFLWFIGGAALMAASPEPQGIPDYKPYSSAHTDKKTVVNEGDFIAIIDLLRNGDRNWHQFRLEGMAYPFFIPVGGLTTNSITVTLKGPRNSDLVRGFILTFNQKYGPWSFDSEIRMLGNTCLYGVTFEEGEQIIKKIRKNKKLMQDYYISEISKYSKDSSQQDAPKGTSFIVDMRQGSLSGVGRHVFMGTRGRRIRILSISDEYMFVT